MTGTDYEVIVLINLENPLPMGVAMDWGNFLVNNQSLRVSAVNVDRACINLPSCTSH